MLELDELTDYVCKATEYPQGVVLDALGKELQGSVFHQTIRTFGDYEPRKYFSLYLHSVSLEAIIWIILSIKADAMQPTETLVHSRFKECFAIKISMKEWKTFVESLIGSEKLQKKMNAFEAVMGRVVVSIEEKTGTVLFTLADEEWEYEDLQDVLDDDKDYCSFLLFIENFFAEKPPKLPAPIVKGKTDQSIKKYLSSVKNSHVNQSTNSCDANIKKIL